MTRVDAIWRALQFMGDAQAMLDGAGVDLAAAQLDLAIHRAEEAIRQLEQDQVSLK